ncbi:hypothetical protein M8J75_000355 [Diaphorina citri]|nr:hypothetical protein M8J75_000355 [Diaphorina citri]
MKVQPNNHFSPYFNFTSSLQQLSETPDTPVEQIPKHLELIKCSLCDRTIDMYIDIDKDVVKRFYCLTCIRTKKIPPCSSKPLYNDLSINGSTKNSSNDIEASSQTKSQSNQTSFSSPSFSPERCHEVASGGCTRYNHFLDTVPCYSVHHVCDSHKGVNKRSWSVANRRPWSGEQKDAIFSYFSQQIENRSTIGKDDIIPLMEINKDLFADRSWKEIKWVYYHHLKVLENRKVKSHNSSESSNGELMMSAGISLVSQQ